MKNEIDLDKLNDSVGMVAGLCFTMYRSAGRTRAPGRCRQG